MMPNPIAVLSHVLDVLSWIVVLIALGGIPWAVWQGIAWRLRRARPGLVIQTNTMATMAMRSLNDQLDSLYVPDEIRPVAERGRQRLQEEVTAILDYASAFRSGPISKGRQLLWEHDRLLDGIWRLRRFPTIFVPALVREWDRLLSGWALHARAEAEGRYLVAVDRALEMPQHSAYQLAMSALTLSRARLDAAVLRVVHSAHAFPDPAVVRAADECAHDFAKWDASASDVVRAADLPPPDDALVQKPKWMLQ